MNRKYLGLSVSLNFLFLLQVTSQQFCGQPKPDRSKTCLSIRLPWQREPIYFCVEKNGFKYRNRCESRHTSDCGTIANDSLVVATPWECCPMTSEPDECIHEQCSPPPFGRKCESLPPKPDDPFECCPSYFCEEDTTPEMCHLKLLDPSCNTPPEGKTNCVAFIDDHGCCPKYQCDGDGQGGECPAEAEAKKHMERYKVKSKSEKGRGMSKMVSKMSSWTGPEHDYTSCVGDHNCPGKLKCCAEDVEVYISETHGYLQRNKDPTNGYCMEAAKNETKQN